MASKLQINGYDLLSAGAMLWGNTGNDMTLASLASGSARIGDEYDRGASPYNEDLWVPVAFLSWDAALTAGVALGNLYILEAWESASYPGELGGTDAAVSATKLNNLSNNLVLSGVADSTSNGAFQVFFGRPIRLNFRYVNAVWHNTGGQAMDSSVPGYVGVLPYSQYRTATA